MIAVNPGHPHVTAALVQQFVDGVLSPAGQASIAAYRIGGGGVRRPLDSMLRV